MHIPRMTCALVVVVVVVCVVWPAVVFAQTPAPAPAPAPGVVIEAEDLKPQGEGWSRIRKLLKP